MKFILQIAAGIVLGGAVLLAATGLMMEHLGLRVARDVTAALERSSELQEAQLAFFQAQQAYLEAQQARISAEIQMAKVTLRQQLGTPPPPGATTTMVEEPTPLATAEIAPAVEREIIARGGNAPQGLEAAPTLGPEEARRKEEAWARFYDKPDDCQLIVDQATMVRCGNHHIVRRREFEQLWEQGMIE